MYKNLLVSEDGSIVNPDVHDAHILGLVMINKKKLLLPVRLTDGSNLCLALSNIDCLRADDFREGNIILDITVSRGTEVDMSDIAYAHGLEQLLSSEANAFLNKAMQDFFIGIKLFVQINPSYGCKLVCICDEIQVLQNWASVINAVRCAKPILP